MYGHRFNTFQKEIFLYIWKGNTDEYDRPPMSNTSLAVNLILVLAKDNDGRRCFLQTF